jgi:hypothetical protein
VGYTGLCLLTVLAHGVDGAAVYPGKTWATREPAEVGLDRGKLDAFRDFVGGRGCVVRHGSMVYSWGDATERGDVASAAKPWYSYFLLRAIENGQIKDADEHVVALESRLFGLDAELDYKDREITWRHLANQTSCYGVSERPGTAFDYNDWQMALFIDTLFTHIYGATWESVDRDVLHPLLTDVLQCEDDPTLRAFGENDRPGRLGISPRDFARFGLLFLREGRWRDRELLSPEHARMLVSSPLPGDFPRTTGLAAEMILDQRTLGSRVVPDNQCDHIGSYSWLWWTNGVDRAGARHWPAVPLDAYGAFGHGGPRAMVVIPSLDLIVSWNDCRVESREAENTALGLLVAAARPEPRAGGVAVDPDDPRWFRHYGAGPLFMCGPGDPEGFLYRGDLRPNGTRAGDQMELIAKLAGTGANCVYMTAVRSHGGDGDSTQDPFVEHDPARGVDERVVNQWNEWLDAMDRAGIVAFLILYDDSALVWETGDAVGLAEREFVHTLVSRLAHHPHLVWCVAEEYGEALSAARVRAIAAEIRAADGFRHPIAVHKNSGLSFAEFADDPSIDQFAVQYNVGTAEELHRGVLEAAREAAGRYSLNLAEAAAWGTGAEARRKAWACAMAGAYVMALGMDIQHTARSDLEDCGRLARFMEAAAPRHMVPRDDLASGGTDYVLARPGESYIAYSSRATRGLGLRGIPAGAYSLTWLDCATGHTITAKATVREGPAHTLALPAGLGPEVAVAVRRVAH